MNRLSLPRFLRLLLCFAAAVGSPATRGAEAAPAGAREAWSSAAFSTNDLVILNTNGVDFAAGTAVFRGDVHVHDPRMYLECDLLTIRFQTNRIAGTDASSLTNASGRLESVVAETNVLLMASGTTITGDRAVYTASNQVAVVTGELVVSETQTGYLLCTNLIFNRVTTNVQVVGVSTMVLKLSGLSHGTDAGPSLLGGPRKPKPAAAQPGKTE